MKKILLAALVLLLFGGMCYASITLTGSGITGARIAGDIVTTGYLVDHSGNRLVTHTPDYITYRTIDK